MAIVINKEIKDAITKMLEHINTVEVQKQTGIKNQTIGKYRSGQIKTMNERTWTALFPLLKKFLPESYQHNERSNVFNGGTHYGAAIANVRDVSTGTDSVERFRAAAIAAIIDLDIDPAAQSAVLKTLKNLKI